ncbi:hypothetical protein Hanom_Chr14g01251591 [Helianthus anomalus]
MLVYLNADTKTEVICMSSFIILCKYVMIHQSAKIQEKLCKIDKSHISCYFLKAVIKQMHLSSSSNQYS